MTISYNNTHHCDDVIRYEAKYSPNLYWVQKGDQGDACAMQYEGCRESLGKQCYAPLTETQCKTSGRRLEEEEEEEQTALQLFPVGGRRNLQVQEKTCAQRVEDLYKTDKHMDFKWWNQYDPYPCFFLIPIADDYAVQMNYTCSDSAFANGFCFEYYKRDGDCQSPDPDSPGCNVASCGFDGGDCGVNKTKVCKCDSSWLGDGFCDVVLGCNVTECGFDNGDCSPCADECSRVAQGDGVCDPACNTPACGLDSAPVVYGCTDSVADNYSPAATRNMADPSNVATQWQCVYAGAPNNGCKDPRALNFASTTSCTYTPGEVVLRAGIVLSTTSDCAAQCAPGCKGEYIRDQHCDPACNVARCNFDGGDCIGVEYCDNDRLCPKSANILGYGSSHVGDCHCDQACNVKECAINPNTGTVEAELMGDPNLWDGGDCAATLPARCQQCAAGCFNSWLGDGVCDPRCNVASCNLDQGDCDWRKSEDYCECECCHGKWKLDVDCAAGAEVCASKPCMHNGLCSDQSNNAYGIGMMDFVCTCASGWTGSQCEIDVDECAQTTTVKSAFCKNGGKCVDSCDLRDVATGLCLKPWISVGAPDYPANKQLSLIVEMSPKMPSVKVNTIICLCAEGWRNGDIRRCSSTDGACLSREMSDRCELDSDECSSLPCKNGARCFQSSPFASASGTIQTARLLPRPRLPFPR